MPESIRRMIGGLRFSYCSEYPKPQADYGCTTDEDLSIQEAADREGSARRACCAGRSRHPSIGLTQVTAAFCNSSALK
jgi:hypothetical protein